MVIDAIERITFPRRLGFYVNYLFKHACRKDEHTARAAFEQRFLAVEPSEMLLLFKVLKDGSNDLTL